MVIHHRIAQDLNGRDTGQLFQTVTNPILPVAEIPASLQVLATQKGLSHAAVDQMKCLHFVCGDDLRAIKPWHEILRVSVASTTEEAA
jgi:hypothetical protein